MKRFLIAFPLLVLTMGCADSLGEESQDDSQDGSADGAPNQNDDSDSVSDTDTSLESDTELDSDSDTGTEKRECESFDAWGPGVALNEVVPNFEFNGYIDSNLDGIIEKETVVFNMDDIRCTGKEALVIIAGTTE
ncbi:MAG: hypothetical protein GY847_26555 [Proteobacteria bacterium]|nr:hypothetical protein [Pseudomonadota bacterium]